MTFLAFGNSAGNNYKKIIVIIKYYKIRGLFYQWIVIKNGI